MLRAGAAYSFGKHLAEILARRLIAAFAEDGGMGGFRNRRNQTFCAAPTPGNH
jgi:hypothetical protein